jgi:hypothetical protein
LLDMDEMRKIRFTTYVIPLKGQFKRPILMVFGDASQEACYCLRWERDNGQVIVAW